jgi:hypothetical protein
VTCFSRTETFAQCAVVKIGPIVHDGEEQPMRFEQPATGDSVVAFVRNAREQEEQSLGRGMDQNQPLPRTSGEWDGWWHSVVAGFSAVTAFIIEGFASYALAMHPEMLCRSREELNHRGSAEGHQPAGRGGFCSLLFRRDSVLRGGPARAFAVRNGRADRSEHGTRDR